MGRSRRLALFVGVDLKFLYAVRRVVRTAALSGTAALYFIGTRIFIGRLFRPDFISLEPLHASAARAAGRPRSESFITRPGDGDSPADVVFRLCRFLRA